MSTTSSGLITADCDYRRRSCRYRAGNSGAHAGNFGNGLARWAPAIRYPMDFGWDPLGAGKGAMCLGQPLPTMNVIDVPADAKPGWNLLDLGIPEPDDFSFGQVQARCGELAVQAVEWAATRCLQDELAAMVTAPINKEAIHAAGYVNDIGHQEILANLAGVSQTATMLMTPGLRVVHLSTHKSLAEAVRFVTAEQVLGKLHLIHETLSQWGLSNPRIAVAALNPHGGEGGLLGREEIEELMPAVNQAQQDGIQATGPLPADSVFNRAIAGEFDMVVAGLVMIRDISRSVHNS